MTEEDNSKSAANFLRDAVTALNHVALQADALQVIASSSVLNSLKNQGVNVEGEDFSYVSSDAFETASQAVSLGALYTCPVKRKYQRKPTDDLVLAVRWAPLAPGEDEFFPHIFVGVFERYGGDAGYDANHLVVNRNEGEWASDVFKTVSASDYGFPQGSIIYSYQADAAHSEDYVAAQVAFIPMWRISSKNAQQELFVPFTRLIHKHFEAVDQRRSPITK